MVGARSVGEIFYNRRDEYSSNLNPLHSWHHATHATMLRVLLPRSEEAHCSAGRGTQGEEEGAVGGVGSEKRVCLFPLTSPSSSSSSSVFSSARTHKIWHVSAFPSPRLQHPRSHVISPPALC